ncbi:MAG TPA: ATP-binding protein [Candidatus Dormibacteraeota bacterium]|jgi:hypothetical protein
MIPRLLEPELLDVLAESRVAFLSGPRQAGKSTLVGTVSGGPWPAEYVSLDDAATRGAASADPEGFLETVGAPVAIDEVQRVPELLIAVKRVVDRDLRPGQFLLTGSADLLHLPRIAETLAGRMEILNLWPMAQSELSRGDGRLVDRLFAGEAATLTPPAATRADVISRILAGGYPEALTRQTPRSRARWFNSYVETIVGRELPAVARIQAADELPRLLTLLAARNASVVNLSDVASGLRISADSVGRYLALLETIYLVKRIPAWMSNIGSRPIKTPKVYFADTGLAGHLLGVDARRLALDPTLLGGLMENFVGMELVKQLTWSAVDAQIYHWRSASGAEVDQVVEERGGRIVGVEVKSSQAINGSDFAHLTQLRDQVGDRFVAGVVMYLGSRTLRFGDRLHAVPASALWT